MSVLRKVLGGLPEVLRSWRGAALVSELGMGFWEGRQFRLYRESTLAAAGVETIRFVAAKPFLLQYQELALIQGDARAVIVSGGTAGGVFVPLPTVNAKYRIDMDPVSTVTVSIGGTVTGGSVRANPGAFNIDLAHSAVQGCTMYGTATTTFTAAFGAAFANRTGVLRVTGSSSTAGRLTKITVGASNAVLNASGPGVQIVEVPFTMDAAGTLVFTAAPQSPSTYANVSGVELVLD